LYIGKQEEQKENEKERLSTQNEARKALYITITYKMNYYTAIASITLQPRHQREKKVKR
jgi:hypothetical protein